MLITSYSNYLVCFSYEVTSFFFLHRIWLVGDLQFSLRNLHDAVALIMSGQTALLEKLTAEGGGESAGESI